MTSKRDFRSRGPGAAADYPARGEARRRVAALGVAAALAAGLGACGAAPQPDFTPEPDPSEDAGSLDAGLDGGSR